MSRTLLATIAILGSLLPSGCHDSPHEDDHGVTLVLKHSKLFGDPAPFDALLAGFQQEHPGIRVKRETLPASSDEQHQFYATNLQARSADFDVFALDVIMGCRICARRVVA